MLDQDSCVVCDYPITDPVCMECYIRETIAKLHDLKIPEIMCNFVKSKLRKMVSLGDSNDSFCIGCGRERVSVCRYCFSLILLPSCQNRGGEV
jgi:hypothetical protein